MKPLARAITLFVAAFVFSIDAAAQSLDGDIFLASASNIWLIRDLNGDGDTLDAGERVLWASVSSVNWTRLAVDDTALYALDSNSSAVWRLRDLNGDGDALDVGEQEIVFSRTGITALAIDSAGALLVSDTMLSITRLADLNHDGDFLDAGEVTQVATSPASVVHLAPREDGRILLATSDSSASVRILRDRDGDGDFFGFAENLTYTEAGPPVVSLTVVDPRRSYALTSGAQQTVVRLEDRTGDDDVLDAGEITLFAGAIPSAVSKIDLLSTGPGDRLLALRSLNGELVLLSDDNGDGDAMDANEIRTVATGLPSPSTFVVRRPHGPSCLAGDVNADGAVSPADLPVFRAILLGLSPAVDPCRDDFNGDGQVNGDDVPGFVAALLSAQ